MREIESLKQRLEQENEYLKEEIKIARSKEKLSADEYIKKLADIPLAFSPGEFFNYSISTDILGFIIERISNMSLEEYFKKNIFEPLEMEDTFFPTDHRHYPSTSFCCERSQEHNL